METDTKFIDDYGTVIFKDKYLFDLLYTGDTDLQKYIANDTKDIRKYNEYCESLDQKEKCIPIYHKLDMTTTDFDKELQDSWFIPQRYLDISVYDYLIELCKTEEEMIRIAEEYVLFEEHKMISVLQLLIYLVDVMREHDIVWGVGRGSSVASYALYLIGIHKVNSIKYKLDIKEFLK